MMESAGIPIISLGLNPTEELSGGAAVAGAYHPALGELVRSRILRGRAEMLLSGVQAGRDVRIHVPRRRLSAMIGQHRENLLWLREKYDLHSVTAVPEEKEELSLELL